MANESRTEDLQTQVARLRAQVESLMQDRVTPAVTSLAGRAEDAFHGATDTVRGQAEMVSGQVKERPMMAILIAAAVGWVIGRAMR